MKKSFLFFVVSFLFLSCNQDDDFVVASIAKADVVGEWAVAHLEKTSGDSTEDLRGYIFEFKDNDVLLVSKESESFEIEGSWSIIESKSVLRMLIPTKTEPLRTFHKEWDVSSLSMLNISMSGLSNELDGNVEYADFEKL